MPDRLLAASTESDTRFQYEIIKSLADSVRQQSDVLRDVQKTQVGMLERLAKIEANRINENVAELRANVNAACDRIDKLEQDKDRRDGAMGAWSWIARNWPMAAMVSALGVFVAWANNKLGG